MKLNRKQNTTVGEQPAWTEGPASPEKRGLRWVASQMQVNCFMSLQAKSFAKAQTRAWLSSTAVLFQADEASGSAGSTHPGSASCKKEGAGRPRAPNRWQLWEHGVQGKPEGTMVSQLREKKNSEKQTVPGFQPKQPHDLRSHLSTWEVSSRR